MRNVLLASAALASLSLGMIATGAVAAPSLGGKAVAPAAQSAIDNVYWRRICDRDGDRCRRVWVRGHWWH